jgi:hypothetical protein
VKRRDCFFRRPESIAENHDGDDGDPEACEPPEFDTETLGFSLTKSTFLDLDLKRFEKRENLLLFFLYKLAVPIETPVGPT